MRVAVIMVIVVAGLGTCQISYSKPKYFKPMTLDMKLRGGVNTSNCTTWMLNCWELVKPQVVCMDGYYYESVCGAMRLRCQPELKYYYNTNTLAIRDSVCY
ncbi:uncharacterized protein LOC121738038 [Aricia agestis]|uniref:uncharacterized protein LOC121738038 n=1 Tax=Aricia agestis TaxID=91739 RepID=UPI001C203BF5|nr:uncharacterized protein LOC121738038 [Aricia agestis]